MKMRKILLVACVFCTATFSSNAFAQFNTLIQSMQQVVQQLDNKKSENKPATEARKGTPDLTKYDTYHYKDIGSAGDGIMDIKYFNDGSVAVDINTSVRGGNAVCAVNAKGKVNGNVIEAASDEGDFKVIVKIKAGNANVATDNFEMANGMCGMGGQFLGEYEKEIKKAALQTLKNKESNQANFLVLYRMKNNKPVKKQIVGVDHGGDLTQHLKPKVEDNKFTLLIKVNDEYAYYVENKREEFDRVGDRMEFVSKDGEKLVITLKTAKQFGELGTVGKVAVTGTFRGTPINEVLYCQYGY